MMRLDEVTRARDSVELRLEGELNGARAQVVEEALQAYGREGIGSVRLSIDGLSRPEGGACRLLLELARAHPRLRLACGRPFLRELVRGYGVEVVAATPRAGGALL